MRGSCEREGKSKTEGKAGKTEERNKGNEIRNWKQKLKNSKVMKGRIS